MKSKYEYAYFCYLLGRDYGQRMVECGIEAMQGGLSGENTILLAGARANSSRDIVGTFIKSGAEIGVTLPDKGQSRQWLVEKRISLVKSEDESLEEAGWGPFNYLLEYIFYKTSRWPGEAEQKFSSLLYRWVLDENNDFSRWNEDLDDFAGVLHRNSGNLNPKEYVIHGVTQLLRCCIWSDPGSKEIKELWLWVLRVEKEGRSS